MNMNNIRQTGFYLLSSRSLSYVVAIPVILFAACDISNAAESIQPITQASNVTIPYPNVDAQLGERLYSHEQATAQVIATQIEQLIRRKYTAGNARRDAHPKAHGCVKAQFNIMQTIPDNLAKGVFIPGKSYAAWIRFSNGSNDPTQADIKGDARGMAIKLLGVTGSKLIEDELQAQTQDFILSNHPVFFNNDPARYLSFFNDVSSDSFLKKLMIPFALGFKGSLIAAATVRSKIPNPVQTRYWSQVPYQLGTGPQRQAVKYSVKSCSAIVDPIPDHPAHDYLRDALRTTLQKDDVCLQFLVQPRTSTKMSVEDSMTEWEETKAPFYQVATIIIPKQTFDTPAQNAFCENLSFTPWHSIIEHKPLGVTNRIRKIVYDRISRTRHEMNSVARQEPN
jgi:hypothetical protein